MEALFLGAIGVALSGYASAADFVRICEANQAFDTGKPTSPAVRRVCQCVERQLGRSGEEAAVGVFTKVLAARRLGLALHPSQVDLDEMVALMQFADGLKACNGSEPGW